MTTQQDNPELPKDEAELRAQILQVLGVFPEEIEAGIPAPITNSTIDELLALIHSRDRAAHSKGMMFALSCTDPDAEVEYPTDHYPITSTAAEWLRKLELTNAKEEE
jgi:hypothetical protein